MIRGARRGEGRTRIDRVAVARRAARSVLAISPKVARVFFGAPVVVDGNTLDVQTQIMLGLLARLPQRPYSEGTALDARKQFDAIMRLADAIAAPAPRVVDRFYSSGGTKRRLRLVYPDLDDRPRPAIVYFHGGGYVVGSIDTVDPACHRMAKRTGAIVVNVDYRLGPETKLPGAPEDCLAAFLWVVEHAAELGIDPGRVAVAGDSAGGGLSAVVCQLARDAGGPMPAFQMLIYPVTDTRITPSRERFREGYLLDLATIDWFLEQYVDPGMEGDFRVAPLRRPDLSGLPPAHVVTAGFDPLRDEGEAYAQRLRDAGNRVTYVCERGLIHGFATLDLLDEGNAAFGRICDVLRRELFA